MTQNENLICLQVIIFCVLHSPSPSFLMSAFEKLSPAGSKVATVTGAHLNTTGGPVGAWQLLGDAKK